MMEFIVNNWLTILLILIVAGKTIYEVFHFRNMPKDEQVEKIRAWLLQAVLMAEREFGGGTGALKLSVVYAEFCKQLPWVAKVITFAQFSDYVDDALERMKEMLRQNKNIAAVVDGEKAEATEV